MHAAKTTAHAVVHMASVYLPVQMELRLLKVLYQVDVSLEKLVLASVHQNQIVKNSEKNYFLKMD